MCLFSQEIRLANDGNASLDDGFRSRDGDAGLLCDGKHVVFLDVFPLPVYRGHMFAEIRLSWR